MTWNIFENIFVTWSLVLCLLGYGIMFFHISHSWSTLSTFYVGSHFFNQSLLGIAARRCKFTQNREHILLCVRFLFRRMYSPGLILHWKTESICEIVVTYVIIQRFCPLSRDFSFIRRIFLLLRFFPLTRDSVHFPEILSINQKFCLLPRDSFL